MFFIHRLPTKFQKYMNALTHLTVAAFMIFLLTTAPRIIKMELYPLELIPGPRYLFALPIFIGSFFILLISLHRLYLIMRYGEDNGTQHKEGGSHSANIKKEKEK
jgi:TRAP-type C4-dicarboxylate transport system permease small subunit